MKESIGNAMLFYIIITFVVVLIMLFVGSLSYSKAYKVKNKIVEEIEKQEAYNEDAVTEIEEWLSSGGTNGKGIGYRINTGSLNNTGNCPVTNSALVDIPTGATLVNQSSNYQYCVYEIDTCANGREGRCGKYYKVVSYMYFDLPIIGDLIKIPVSGETMIFTEVKS